MFLSPFHRPFSRWICISRFKNVSILDIIGAKGDGGGGDNWRCKALVKSSPPTNQHPVFYRPDALLSPNRHLSEHWRIKYHVPWRWSPQAHLGSSDLVFVAFYYIITTVTGSSSSSSSSSNSYWLIWLIICLFVYHSSQTVVLAFFGAVISYHISLAGV